MCEIPCARMGTAEPGEESRRYAMKKRARRAKAQAIFAALTALMLSGVMFAAAVGSPRPAAPAPNDIAIGVVLPLTGSEAKPGQYQKEGIELAFKQFNDKGGVFVRDQNKKLPFREVFYDDGTDQA